jgi:hypothetical protein
MRCPFRHLWRPACSEQATRLNLMRKHLSLGSALAFGSSLLFAGCSRHPSHGEPRSHPSERPSSGSPNPNRASSPFTTDALRPEIARAVRPERRLGRDPLAAAGEQGETARTQPNASIEKMADFLLPEPAREIPEDPSPIAGPETGSPFWGLLSGKLRPTPSGKHILP